MNNKAAENMSTAEDPSSSRESLSTAHSKKKKKVNEKCIVQSSAQSEEHTKFTKNELDRLQCY